RGTLGTLVKVSTDIRTNSVVVHAGPRDLEEAERLLLSVDVLSSPVQNELRIFKLGNAMASDLAPILQQAITGRQAAGAGGQQGGAQAGQNAQGTQQEGGTTRAQTRLSGLSFITLDAEGRRVLESGILSDVIITADTNSNAILVRGPGKSMELIAALIRELDRLPESEAQIKVFTIVNGDATALGTMLQQLFGQQTGGNQGDFAQPVTAGGENSLVPLSFAVDSRTNSIIASGASGDLNVVEAILLRLDEGDVRQRKTTVYRLKNAPAIDVANAINQFLTSERAVQQTVTTAVSPFEQLEREVVVVPEAVSNSLIVSATPRFYEEIARVVEELDARPPMVMIQVLIAEVSLNDQEEFGAEFGLQDSILFDRSTSVGGVGVPGFNFNNQPLGNSNSAQSLGTRNDLGTQSLTSFSVGRSNGPLGYGGLVLSASNDSVSILIRALQDSQRLQVLSRPQVMTLDNQSAFVQVGQRVPRITSTTNSQNGITNATVLENVGLLLGVTPRISPDGLVVMEIDAEKSQLGPVDTGIPISINENGDVIRSPIINTTLAQTTVSARSGQTVILSGLITKNRSITSRRIPYLSDIPVLGRLFRFDSAVDARTELLIIMTPHIVRNESDAEWLKQVESDRMSWCLADVVEIHGAASGLSGGHGLWGPANAPVIFPDTNPTGAIGPDAECYDAPLPLGEGEALPTPGVRPGAMSAPTTPVQPGTSPFPAPKPDPSLLPPKTSDRSSRRVEGNKAVPAKVSKQAAYTPYPQPVSESGIRSEKSDTATVFYAAPPGQPGARGSAAPAGSVYGPP
ncbi:MAG TPA: secretin N-terminal domain-containing protein, partial [Pirellulaceae bacterium]|nr:secretin N-terminal domain-containing protein [Pirellulaceae bacterium]